MATPQILDRFMPRADVRERFETTIRAPALVVMDIATTFDMQSLFPVRAIFRTREWLTCARRGPPRQAQQLLAEMTALGWGVLDQEPGRRIVCGAVCQPWLANVEFSAIESGAFAVFAEPDRVKIAWTLEADPIDPSTTRFAHETRAVATDESARAKFRRYWRWARFGIVGIRLLILPAIRRAAERRVGRPSPTG